MVHIPPKEFMKSRKPGQFSDSKIVKEQKINRTLLEYTLDNLGSKKQEYEFENFSRKLCEYEICPNLRPQTGPTGGGDSKVDSETIPMASQLRIGLYEGTDNQTSENFAFAMSTQKTWQDKMRTDINKIKETKRDYSKIFFITNQFVSDKHRAKAEKNYSTKKVKIIILDRTWILDRVFRNRRGQIAIDELNLGEGLNEIKETGPVDFERGKKASDLNSSIELDIQNNNITIQTVDDALDVAILSRQLEEPKDKIFGLFDRALRFAKEYGTTPQYFNAIYQKAWTAFFWFEDYESFVKMYDEVELLALSSNSFFDTERLNNLYSLLYSATVNSQKVTVETLKAREDKLESKLESFIKEKTMPSTSANAELILCFLKITKSIDDIEETKKHLRMLKVVIRKATHLAGFPFEVASKLLNELNDLFKGIPEYEELQEYLVELNINRGNEKSTGKVLFDRGIQLVKGGKTLEAIKYFGKALWRFSKEESQEELADTLFLISGAYEDVGLLWASRSALLHASHLLSKNFETHGSISKIQVKVYDKLRTLELRLGRIGYVLEWHLLHSVFAKQLVKNQEDSEKMVKNLMHFDSVLGMLLIKTKDEELEALQYLPDTLDELDLFVSYCGMLYRLGGEKFLPPEFLNNINGVEIEGFFNKWLEQPVQESLPEYPEYYLGNKVTLKTKILGCNYIIESENISPQIEIGEYLLASLESFLSTTIGMDTIASENKVNIKIQELKNEKEPKLKFKVSDDGVFTVLIQVSDFDPHSLSPSNQEIFSKNIYEIVVTILSHTVIFKDIENDLVKLFKDEEVMARSTNYTSPLIVLGNVLDKKPRRAITQWIDSSKKEYTYSKSDARKPKLKHEEKVNDNDFGVNNPENTLSINHTNIENQSVIRPRLWDNSIWNGVSYLTSEELPPIMILVFENKKDAEIIFKGWRERFGRVDNEDVIRISSIRGISSKNPNWYKINITTNIDFSKKENNKRIVIGSKACTLTPISTSNLDRFSESFKKFKEYKIIPAVMNKENGQHLLMHDIGIIKSSFIERFAWQIGPNDLDSSAINTEMDPVIPVEIKDAPILDLIKHRKENKQ